MNRLIPVVLILFLFVSSAPSAIASEVGYELKVTGMVCAFCAYNVSKQLRSAEGVAPDSILVDLENGTITLRSEKPLERARLAKLVEAAGFALEAVTETTPDSPLPAPRAERAARISLTLDANGSRKASSTRCSRRSAHSPHNARLTWPSWPRLHSKCACCGRS